MKEILWQPVSKQGQTDKKISLCHEHIIFFNVVNNPPATHKQPIAEKSLRPTQSSSKHWQS